MNTPALNNSLRQVPSANSASDEEVTQLLERAEQEVNRLHQEVAQQRSREYERHKTAFQRASQRATRAMERHFEASLFAPLSGLIAPLVGTLPDPVATAAGIAGFVTTLNRIQREFNESSATQQYEIAESIDAPRAEMHQAASDAQSSSHRSREIADAMQAVASNPGPATMRQLQQLLGNDRSPRPGTLQRPQALSPRLAARPQQRTPAAVPGLSKHSQTAIDTRLTQLIRDVQRDKFQINRADPAELNQAFQRQLADQFRGLSGQQVEQKKQALIEEAKRRFATDQAQQTAVITKIRAFR